MKTGLVKQLLHLKLGEICHVPWTTGLETGHLWTGQTQRGWEQVPVALLELGMPWLEESKLNREGPKPYFWTAMQVLIQPSWEDEEHLMTTLEPRWTGQFSSVLQQFVSSSSSSQSSLNNSRKQMRSSVNIQPHQDTAALCYPMWKSSLLLQSLPSWHFTGNTKPPSCHSPSTRSALRLSTKLQGEYSNSEDRLNQSSELEDCRGKQNFLNFFLAGQVLVLWRSNMCQGRNSLNSSSYRLFHLYRFRLTSIHEHLMDRRNTRPSTSQ